MVGLGRVVVAGGPAGGGPGRRGPGALVWSSVAVASTGTAILSLSGAAATSATLARLGGGSLAAGGFGVWGGTIVATGGAALIVAVLFALPIWAMIHWDKQDRNDDTRLSLQRLLQRDHFVTPDEAARLAPAR